MLLSRVICKAIKNAIQKIKRTITNKIYDCSDALVAPEDVRVIGGTKYRYEEELNTFITLLEEIKIHENFSRSSLENNVALGIVSDSQHYFSLLFTDTHSHFYSY